jgi:dolichyl-phosphate-mannose--protein O-mannosyl transferase
MSVLFLQAGDVTVFCLGNLFVYWIAFVGVVAVFVGFKKRCYFRAIGFVIGYLMSYLPFFLVPRTMFLYHYIIPLMFACVCTGIMLDFWLGPIPKGIILVLICGIVLFGYSEWAPFVYGRAMSETEMNSRMWRQAWRSGRAGRGEWMRQYDKKFEVLRAQETTYFERMKKMGYTI